MTHDGGTMQNTTAKTLGRYNLLRRIGRGGMGDVWLGEDPRLHRQVAIKTLPAHSQSDREFSQRFEREAQAAAALNHPHILPVHDYGEQPLPNGQVITYIVMPYVAGGSLADLISKLGAGNANMAPHEAVAYLSQAAEAIDYAHAQGIIHRDIKPANMLLRNDQWLLLADFGIARMLSDTGHLTQTGVGFGTPEYMAPEQAQGKAEAASDNYSLAVIAYQLFTGRLPFHADTGYAITIQHMISQPLPPRQINPYLPPAVEEILLRGLAKQPAQRLPSARAFVAELQRNMMGVPFEATFAKPQPPLAAPIYTNYGREQASLPTERNTNTGRQDVSAAPTILDKGATPNTFNVTRRRLLIGGGAALGIIGAGMGTWEIATHLNSLKLQQSTSALPRTTTAKTASSPVADPNGPSLILRAHDQPVYALTWSPKKNLLASAADDKTVMLWNIGDFQLHTTVTKSSVTRPLDHGYKMRLAWSPDGQYLAIANTGTGADFNSSYVSVYMANLNTPAPGYENPLLITGDSIIQGLGWLQQGRYIITALDPLGLKTNNQFQIALSDTKQPKLALKPILITADILGEGSTAQAPQCLSVSPDGTLVAFPLANDVVAGQVSIAGNVVKWQPSPGTLKFKTDFSRTAVALTWSPNGRYLVGISNDKPTIMVGWDMKNSQQPPISLSLPASDTELTTVAWCSVPLSPLLAAGSKTGEVYLWSTDKNQLPARTLNSGGINAAVQALAWSADGQWLAASYGDDNDTILVWKV